MLKKQRRPLLHPHHHPTQLQEETEAHFNTDGRRVRLGEEVERLRGILRMYSIPF